MSIYAANPMTQTIDEAENIIIQLNAEANRLAETIAYEQTVYGLLKSAQEGLEDAESEAITEAVMLAQNKEGPLAGIATTSKAYDHALKTLVAGHRRDRLAHLHAEVQKLEIEHVNARIDRQQAETHFSALKRVAELKAQILRAGSM